MEQFKHITDWELQSFSHEFPGPDGGTCINEAAIIACGMPYKSIKDLEDLPPCFSRVVAGFAMFLNDMFSHSDRQQLMPFVTQLSGTASPLHIEQTRFKYITIGLRLLFVCDFQSDVSVMDRLSSLGTYEYRYPCNMYAIRDILGPLLGKAYFIGEIHYYVTALLSILQQAILMGNHPTEHDLSLVNKRMEIIKQQAKQRLESVA